MTAHSRVGGSKAKQWMNCPGSVVNQALVSREMPEEESKYAKEGTDAHAVAELLVKDWQPPGTVDADMVRYGLQYKDGLSVYQDLYPGFHHTELHVPGTRFSSDLFGTIDYVQVSTESNTVIIVDYKYGAGEYVEVKENEQLLYYGMLVLDRLSKVKGWHYPHEIAKPEFYDFSGDFILAIFQPRGENPGWRQWVVPTSRIIEFSYATALAIKRIETGDATLNAGDWCRWCTAKAKCRAYAEKFPLKGFEAAKKKLENMTAEEIATLYNSKSEVDRWFKSAEAYLKAVVELSDGNFFIRNNEQEVVYHYTLGNKKGRTEWDNAIDIEQQYTPEQFPEFYRRELKTPNQILKLRPDLKGELKHQYTQREYATLVKVEEPFKHD